MCLPSVGCLHKHLWYLLMLKPLLFVPCDRVIIGQDNVSSLISIMEAFNVNVRAELPPDATTPTLWHVVTYWNRTEEVQGVKAFEQRVDLIRPDGENIGSIPQDFEVSNEFMNFRNITQIHGFPIGLAGIIRVKLSLREAGENNEWREVAEFPIKITHHGIETAQDVSDEETRTEAAEAE